MTDERMARPVSGEIMSGDAPPAAARPLRADADVVDADFESVAVRSAPARSEMQQEPGSAGSAAAPARGMDILMAAEQPQSRRAGPAFWLFGAVLVAGAFWVSGGHALVSRPAPAVAPPVVEADPREGLRIIEVTSRIERAGSRAFVLVDGQVVNTGARTAPLPALDIRVTDAAGRSTRYSLGTGDRRLTPGERFAFSSRLEAPADGVGTVTVDFENGES